MSTTATIRTTAATADVSGESCEACPAELFADRYELEEALGRGAAGSVYRARDIRTGAECALKLLHKSDSESADYARFLREAILASELFHPHIVEVREFGHDAQGTPYLVMELLRGPTLYDVLKRQGRLPLGYALELLRQIGSAIHTAHIAGIVHRDIKPQNVVLHRVESEGRITEVAKVVDFGIAKNIGAPTAESASNLILGTWEYIAPEATWGVRDAVDARADQFSLAVVAYRMLSGRLPFQSQSGDPIEILRKVRNLHPPTLDYLVPELPARVVDAVHRALSKRREDRFETTQDFVRALCGLAPKKGVVRAASSDSLTKSRHALSRSDEGAASPVAISVPAAAPVETSEPYADLSIHARPVTIAPPPLAPPPRRSHVGKLGLYLLSLLVLGIPAKAATVRAVAERVAVVAPASIPIVNIDAKVMFPGLPIGPPIALPSPAPAAPAVEKGIEKAPEPAKLVKVPPRPVVRPVPAVVAPSPRPPVVPQLRGPDRESTASPVTRVELVSDNEDEERPASPPASFVLPQPQPQLRRVDPPKLDGLLDTGIDKLENGFVQRSMRPRVYEPKLILPAPILSRHKGEAFHVRYLVCFDRNGVVQRVRAITPLHDGEEALLSTLRSWRYAPGTNGDCELVQQSYQIASE